jgi:hypothetical protein
MVLRLRRNTRMTNQRSPEEEELAAKQGELRWLEFELMSKEEQLGVMKEKLAAFEERYDRVMGALNAELDRWKERLARLPADQFGKISNRNDARQSFSPNQESRPATLEEVSEPGSSSQRLKSLYRNAARLVHPDLSISEKDRPMLEQSMKIVNAAYAAGDEKTLQEIVQEAEYSPDSVEGAGVGAELIRILRQLRRLRMRLSAIELEMTDLSRSTLGQLSKRVDGAAGEGRDLLSEMAIELQGRLDGLRRRFGDVVSPAGE